MSDLLGVLVAPRRTGAEPFHHAGNELGFDVHDFWAWSVSDLVSNATRGRVAEYLVARATGISTAGVRNEWAAYDLQTRSGIKIEVKSAAYLQAWYQKRLSKITFSTRASRAWDPATNVVSDDVIRQADVYVFALLVHVEKETLDPLDVRQWRFFVLPTTTLDNRTRSQHSITLKSLQALCRASSFVELADAVDSACRAVQR